MPGQQIVDPVDRVVGDAGEDVAQVGLGVEAPFRAAVWIRVYTAPAVF
jgi:hypothetical protein